MTIVAVFIIFIENIRYSVTYLYSSRWVTVAFAYLANSFLNTLAGGNFIEQLTGPLFLAMI